MKSNLGSVDRLLRLIVGAVLVVLALTGVIGAWGWLGIILLATGLINFCPLYRILGFSSDRSKKL
jgi:O-antigen ligase